MSESSSGRGVPAAATKKAPGGRVTPAPAVTVPARDTRAPRASSTLTAVNASLTRGSSSQPARPSPTTRPAGGAMFQSVIGSNGPVKGSSTRSYRMPICIAQVQPALS